MIINITILEDNESDFITLSDSIKKWAANTGILINIIWLNIKNLLNPCLL